MKTIYIELSGKDSVGETHVLELAVDDDTLYAEKEVDFNTDELERYSGWFPETITVKVADN